MDRHAAAGDLRYIREVLDRTHRRIDPHAFHFVHWGAIVLVWYPLSTLLARWGREEWMLPLGIGALALGAFLSGFREWRLGRKPRLPAENTFIARQVVWIVYATLAAAAFLSGFGPATGVIEGPDVPVIWGLAYANMAFMVGVVYSREYLWAGAAIFAGCLLAMVFPGWNGVILGPFMGLGMIVPGILAERRVRRLAAEDAGDPAAA